MNYKELIARISEKSGLSKQETERLIDVTTASFTSQLTDGKTIGVQGFGNFEVRKKDERLSVHPTTQVRTLIPPKLVINFKQSNILKEKINENQQK